MTHRDPFQPLLFCDSVRCWQSLTPGARARRLQGAPATRALPLPQQPAPFASPTRLFRGCSPARQGQCFGCYDNRDLFSTRPCSHLMLKEFDLSFPPSDSSLRSAGDGKEKAAACAPAEGIGAQLENTANKLESLSLSEANSLIFTITQSVA